MREKKREREGEEIKGREKKVNEEFDPDRDWIEDGLYRGITQRGRSDRVNRKSRVRRCVCAFVHARVYVSG